MSFHSHVRRIALAACSLSALACGPTAQRPVRLPGSHGIARDLDRDGFLTRSEVGDSGWEYLEGGDANGDDALSAEEVVGFVKLRRRACLEGTPADKKAFRCSDGGLWIGTSAVVGRALAPSHLRALETGQDKAQIRSWFGDPTHSQPMEGSPKGCVELWVYSHGNEIWAEALAVSFDSKGKVCTHAYRVEDHE